MATKGEEARLKGDGLEEDAEEDFMSDKFLVDASTETASTSREKQKPLTYTERRRQAINAAIERGRIKSRIDREKEARKTGLSQSLLEKYDNEAATPGTKRKSEAMEGAADGGACGSKALRMMMSMGFEPGQSIGKRVTGGESAQLTPIEPDERWLSKSQRSGIGRLPKTSAIALVHDIESAASSAAKDRSEADDGVENFRARTREAHEVKHAESLLRSARSTCENLDRTGMGMTYSPLWLDVLTLSRKQEELPANVRELNEFAFAGLDVQKDGKETEISKEDDVENSVEEIVRIERMRIARSFAFLSASARLQITTSHLRRAHNYCLYCGHRYATQAELEASCPGEGEEDH